LGCLHQIWFAGSHGQPAAILKNGKSQQNSAAIGDVLTKFGKQVDIDRPQRAVTSFLTYNKIQGGSRSLECWSTLGYFRAFQKY